MLNTKSNYYKKLEELNKKNAHICEFKGDKLFFEPYFILILVKASGLKSSKRRHIVKRFKKLMSEILYFALDKDTLLKV